jgi:hypothetical protein
LLTIYFLFTSIITGESIKNFSCRILFGITMIGGLALLWALCQLPLLHHLTKDGSIDTQRILSSGLVYSLLLNTVIWIPPLWKNHRPQLLLTFITLLGCLMLVHIVSPYIIPRVALPKYKSFFSPDLHHVLPPKTRMFAGKYDGFNVIIQTNEDGLRTNYSRIQFTSLSPRIIVMGDSFTFGLGVRQNKVWPQLLEDRLRVRFQRNDIGVLNAGIISYSPILQARQFDAILRYYKPDLVILLLDPTDIGDDYNYAAEFKTLHPPVAMNPLKKMPSGILHMSQGVREYIQSALSFPFDFASTTISNRSASPTDIENYDYYKFHLEIGGSVESNRFFIYRHPLDDTLPYFNFTYSNIAHIARATQGLGADFILAPSPRFHHWNRKECPANWEASSYRLDEPYQFEFFRYFSERAGSGQIEVLDLLGAFQATTNFPLVFNSDPHWNEAGNSFVANVIEEYIVTHHATLFANPQRIEKEPNKRPQK